MNLSQQLDRIRDEGDDIFLLRDGWHIVVGGIHHEACWANLGLAIAAVHVERRRQEAKKAKKDEEK